MMRSTLVCVALALAASLSLGAASQPAQPSNDPMAALLSEVHALRLAMEQSAAVAPRVQLTLARLNIQEQRVTQLGTQLDQLRKQLAQAAENAEKMSNDLNDAEKLFQTTGDDKIRRSMEYMQTDLKRRQAAQAVQEQQLRTRENETAQTLSSEQARWVDLNARLDELERLLAPVR
jgi:chromosome segregation ATPase